MNDNTPSGLSDLQGPRLIRAFLQIRDRRARSELVEEVERLAQKASAASVASLSGSSEFAELPTDPLG